MDEGQPAGMLGGPRLGSAPTGPGTGAGSGPVLPGLGQCQLSEGRGFVRQTWARILPQAPSTSKPPPRLFVCGPHVPVRTTAS